MTLSLNQTHIYSRSILGENQRNALVQILWCRACRDRPSKQEEQIYEGDLAERESDRKPSCVSSRNLSPISNMVHISSQCDPVEKDTPMCDF
jgi:hypothetical protein